MTKPLEVDEQWRDRILSQVSGLQYGQVIITVHDGRIVQIDRTERTRYDAAAQKSEQPAASQSSQRKKGAGALSAEQQSQERQQRQNAQSKQDVRQSQIGEPSLGEQRTQTGQSEQEARQSQASQRQQSNADEDNGHLSLRAAQ